MIIRDAARGSTTDELHYFNNTFTYKVILNISQDKLKPHLEEFKQEVENTFYPVCINTLKNYLKKREDQINRKVKPRVRFLQKSNSDSGGFRVSCLATGFYPRHINLTLFRDGQPVSDHEITGGDLLPNGDGTYQMRKSLEISADKHKYTCSATHLSLDNKLDVTLEFEPGDPFKSVIINFHFSPAVHQMMNLYDVSDNDKPGEFNTKIAFDGSTPLQMKFVVVLALMMVFGAAAVIWKKQCADAVKRWSPNATDTDIDAVMGVEDIKNEP
ncbi:major histocompatibility complex class I-related gene protein-like [Chanodichthys erythropterus]|uniref:major histocompatibility complex class I-related gene protein-like n=1 Tax=Chanodichthys erythropterus TaxID=933992 RepID=UPI00351DAA2C